MSTSYITRPDLTHSLVVYRGCLVGSWLHQAVLHSRQRCNCHSPSDDKTVNLGVTFHHIPSNLMIKCGVDGCLSSYNIIVLLDLADRLDSINRPVSRSPLFFSCYIIKI